MKKAKLDILTAELANALAACDASPLLPLCFDEFMEGGNARNLPVEVRYIQSKLPHFLLKSSAEELSELTVRLKNCAEFAKKADELHSVVTNAVKLISEFDEEVLDLGAHVQAMVDEAID
jgi:hypothetical protein